MEANWEAPVAEAVPQCPPANEDEFGASIAQYPDARILIVDDQRVNTVVLEHLLRKAGYRHVESLTDSSMALSRALEFRFDLILLDIMMPALDGYGFMEELAELRREDIPPIIVLTSLDDTATRLRAFACGALEFLNKPFVREEALLRIRNVLEVRMLNNALRDQNRMLEERVKQRTDQLRASQYEVIQRLTRASEFRDNETGEHIERMSRYCAAVGESYGLDEYRCELLLNASAMHDVGKIGIPDRILLKPGPLDPSEWEVMKTHCEIGARLLEGNRSPLMAMAYVIALTHHERWDGSGYPRGLTAEAIPLEGRICAICDVFDALTSARPYKKAWSVEAAVEEIRKQSGRHFDPSVAEVFLSSTERLLEIRAGNARS